MSGTSLLSLLEAEAGAFVSGEEISRQLGVSRTAVWKQIRKLEAEGYEIEAVPRLGYRLNGRPSRLSLQELLPKLVTREFGRRLKLFDDVGSTQDELRKLAEEGAPQGTLVVAERQTQGRGRMGRSWLSPAGKGVWMSLLLRPEIPLPLTPQLTLLAAVALSRAIARVVPLEIGIKWPNDLLVNGKKISGILLESSAEDERLKYVIVGMGISANLDPEDYPEELLDKAVSLKMASGQTIDRSRLIAAVMDEFERLYDLYRDRGFAPIRSLWEAHSVTLGRPAVLRTPQGTVEGVPVSLDESGGLKVRLANGETKTVFSAEFGETTGS
ncbi:biotin--[acetyl-CoA-carboxylase] ligase [Cohnella candidum]|uniref:Bifunctional ligase/repressor BirA n=1 Tax=Cohnella candidum TaxID=2674991 RepID=A0A3G3JWT3_9BACL|nr:biotin--[acetyl-CoA-carboxylase] ligase [Cohnella candidum]AYQ72686.1 biotin--[acetyl-CoA-carboxylase] ligase [Cohnella candidum]